VTLDCPSCGGHLFTQGHHEALVCLNTKCALYAQPQPDVDAGQTVAPCLVRDDADDWADAEDDDEWDEGDDD
jgi:hypothetical protein